MTRRGGCVLALAIAAIVSGCSALSAQPDRTRYFVLTPLAVSERPRTPAVQATVGVEVKVPDSLNRYLVTRLSNNEIAISDTDRWADPLGEALSRVLRDNLAVLLSTQRVLVFPWESSSPPDIIVEVDLLQFEQSSRRSAEITARWSVARGSDRGEAHTEQTSVSEPMVGTDAQAAAAALSAGLGRLSRDIAAGVRQSTSR
jgi:uncharacterized protein